MQRFKENRLVVLALAACLSLMLLQGCTSSKRFGCDSNLNYSHRGR